MELLADVAAAVAGGVAAHGDARESVQARRERVPDPAREVLEARLREPGDVVQHAMVEAAADFSENERIAAETSLAALPDGGILCHGDFHPTNILFSEHGPVIIDWIGATRGHRYADVARTSVMFQSAELPKESSVLIRLMFWFSRRLLHDTYLRRYLQICGGTRNDIEQWRPAQEAAASAWRCKKYHL